MRYLLTGYTPIYSTSPAAREFAVGELVTSPILNAAAHIRAGAVSGGNPIGVDGIQDRLDWRGLLYATERSLYLNGCAFWRIQRGRRAPDMDAELTITLYQTLARNANGDYASVDGVIPPDEIVEMRGYENPLRAVARLKDILTLEAQILQGWGASAKAVVNPRYILTRPNTTPPANDAQVKAQRDRFEELLDSAVVPLFGEEMFAPLPAAADMDSIAKMNEVRRIVSMDSGVPSQLLGSPENAQYAQLTQIMRAFYEDTIRYEVERIGSAIRAQGALPDFAIDISGHYAVAETLREQAATQVLRAGVLKRLTDAGMPLAQALAISGVAEMEVE